MDPIDNTDCKELGFCQINYKTEGALPFIEGKYLEDAKVFQLYNLIKPQILKVQLYSDTIQDGIFRYVIDYSTNDLYVYFTGWVEKNKVTEEYSHDLKVYISTPDLPTGCFIYYKSFPLTFEEDKFFTLQQKENVKIIKIIATENQCISVRNFERNGDFALDDVRINANITQDHGGIFRVSKERCPEWKIKGDGGGAVEEESSDEERRILQEEEEPVVDDKKAKWFYLEYWGFDKNAIQYDTEKTVFYFNVPIVITKGTVDFYLNQEVWIEGKQFYEGDRYIC